MRSRIAVCVCILKNSACTAASALLFYGGLDAKFSVFSFRGAKRPGALQGGEQAPPGGPWALLCRWFAVAVLGRACVCPLLRVEPDPRGKKRGLAVL